MADASLEQLLERVRQATRSDRALDRDILEALGWAVGQHSSPGTFSIRERIGHGWTLYLTASVYECELLMREVLPVLNVHITNWRLKGGCRVTLCEEQGSGKTLHEMNVASAERLDNNFTLALLEAILQALTAQAAHRAMEKTDA